MSDERYNTDSPIIFSNIQDLTYPDNTSVPTKPTCFTAPEDGHYTIICEHGWRVILLKKGEEFKIEPDTTEIRRIT